MLGVLEVRRLSVSVRLGVQVFCEEIAAISLGMVATAALPQ